MNNKENLKRIIENENCTQKLIQSAIADNKDRYHLEFAGENFICRLTDGKFIVIE